MVLGWPCSSHSQGAENNLLKVADENLNSYFNVGSPIAFERLEQMGQALFQGWAGETALLSLILWGFCKTETKEASKRKISVSSGSWWWLDVLLKCTIKKILVQSHIHHILGLPPEEH